MFGQAFVSTSHPVEDLPIGTSNPVNWVSIVAWSNVGFFRIGT